MLKAPHTTTETTKKSLSFILTATFFHNYNDFFNSVIYGQQFSQRFFRKIFVKIFVVCKGLKGFSIAFTVSNTDETVKAFAHYTHNCKKYIYLLIHTTAFLRCSEVFNSFTYGQQFSQQLFRKTFLVLCVVCKGLKCEPILNCSQPLVGMIKMCCE